jgi:PAS domain S-box-containing protein
MKLSIESKVAIGFILSLLIVISFSFNTFFGMRSLIRENNTNKQIHEILKWTREAQFHLINCAASCREFVLSGSGKTYDSYMTSIKKAEQLFSQTISKLDEKENEEAVSIAIKHFFLLKALNDQIIETRKKEGVNQALSLLLEGKVAESGNKIVIALNKIQDSQRNKILMSFQNDIDAANRTIKSFGLLVISIVIVLSAVYYLFKKDLAERRSVHEKLDQMNETLEHKIKARTQALIQSSEKYRFLTENVKDVISLHDRGGFYTYVSESLKQMAGYEPHEMTGRTGYDFVHPDDVAYLQNIHRSILSNKPYTGAFNFRFLKKSGNYFWVESVANVVRDSSGEFENIIVCTRDISARVKTENELKEHQQMLQGILDNTQSMIFIRNLNGEYLLTNNQFEKMKDSIQGNAEEVQEIRRMEEILPVEMLYREKQKDNEILGANLPVEFEVKVPVSNSLKDYSFTKFPLYNEEAKIYAVCGIGTDITSQKKAQREISDSKAKLLALLHNSSDAIWSVNRELKLSDFNTSCKYMMEKFYHSAVFSEMSVERMSDRDTWPEWEEQYQRALEGESFSKEMKLVDGPEYHYYDVSFNPVVVNQRVEGVAVFARDITARKKTEKQLSYKVNELNTFMYKATHDLRSPLVSLMGLVDLAKSEMAADAPELKKYFEMIGKSVSKMDKLLIDLVGITNVSQGKLQINKVDFGKMTTDIIDSLGHHPNFECISIRKVINDDIPFYSDDKLLYSVMQNLIDNAIKYRKTGSSTISTISIIIECSAQSTAINIIDNGIGIADNSQEKVFDMFYRAASISSGTGLGLYIVKTAVEKMNGKISLASKESEGTSVYITLPNLTE